MSRETNEVEFMGLGATAIDLEEPSSNTKGKRQGSTSRGTHPHKRKMGEKEGITAPLDKMANSFNRMVEKMDGKVDDEDIQEVLREAALIPDLNRQQWAKAIKWLADDPVSYCESPSNSPKDKLCFNTSWRMKLALDVNYSLDLLHLMMNED
ncbi:hypothetical protein JHK87_006394 [Glycine soja]|nr:hypothetical protein JHK87_006394 [Glycine soja]